MTNTNNREDGWWRSIEHKKELVNKAKKYVGGQDVSCWDTFLEEQSTITRRYIDGTYDLKR